MVANSGNCLYLLLLKLLLLTAKALATDMEKSLSTGLPLMSVAVISIFIFSLDENVLFCMLIL